MSGCVLASHLKCQVLIQYGPAPNVVQFGQGKRFGYVNRYRVKETL
jgi:hypothetical protein